MRFRRACWKSCGVPFSVGKKAPWLRMVPVSLFRQGGTSLHRDAAIPVKQILRMIETIRRITILRSPPDRAGRKISGFGYFCAAAFFGPMRTDFGKIRR